MNLISKTACLSAIAAMVSAPEIHAQDVLHSVVNGVRATSALSASFHVTNLGTSSASFRILFYGNNGSVVHTSGTLTVPPKRTFTSSANSNTGNTDFYVEDQFNPLPSALSQGFCEIYTNSTDARLIVTAFQVSSAGAEPAVFAPLKVVRIFDEESAPSLSANAVASPEGTKVDLKWPASVIGHILQRSTDLKRWENLPAVAQITGGQYVVRRDPNEREEFFRLYADAD